MSYLIEGTNVYYQSTGFTQFYGPVTKVESERVDDQTVVEKTYIFDVEQGKYIEQSAIPHEDIFIPPPPPPPTINEQVSDLQDVVNIILMGGL